MTVNLDEVDTLCREFYEADSFRSSVDKFDELCKALDIDRSNHVRFYKTISESLKPLTSFKKGLWRLLDARAAQPEYLNGNIGRDKRILIVGAGPCGLRMAIECALLGAKVVVIEMRDYISRNNVLHLWPFVIQDMKSIGAKEFYPKFASGNLNHVSIRKMQLMLLKVAVILGVEVHAPVRFIDLVEPTADEGWKVAVSPVDSVVNTYEFDVVIGANGARNTLRGFKRKNPFRAKLAIAITANFVNKQTKEDIRVEEIPGIFCFMNPEFFGVLKSKGFDLENFVYYKDETHYFVMTVKKESLLSKKVLKKDYSNPAALLAEDNIDKANLRSLAREIAQITTAHQIPDYQYAQTHRGEDDVAVFDFTVMYQAENSVLAREVNGKKLLTSIIGDSLINPFWPRGTGCAHGFLGAFDTAWLIRNWFQGSRPETDILCERETNYSLLSQTTPGNLNKNLKMYSIDPKTRYSAQLIPSAINPINPEDLYKRGRLISETVTKPELSPTPEPAQSVSKQHKRTREHSKSLGDLEGSSLDTHRLLNWYREKLINYQHLAPVSDLNDSWKDGMAFCALLTVYRPELINVSDLDPTNVLDNTSRAFELYEREFGVSPMLSPSELASKKPLDRLAMLSYLACLQEELIQDIPLTAKSRKLEPENYKSLEEYMSLTLPRDSKGMVHYMASQDNVIKSLSLDRTWMNKKSKGIKNKSDRKMFKAVRKIYMQRAFVPKGFRLPGASVDALIAGNKPTEKVATNETIDEKPKPPEITEQVTTVTKKSSLRVPNRDRSTSPKPNTPKKPKVSWQPEISQKEASRSGPAVSRATHTTTFPTPEPSLSPTHKNATLKEILEAKSDEEDDDREASRDDDFWRNKTKSIKACRGMVKGRLGIFGGQVSPLNSPNVGNRDRSYSSPAQPSEPSYDQNLPKTDRKYSTPERPLLDGHQSPSPLRTPPGQGEGTPSESRSSPPYQAVADDNTEETPKRISVHEIRQQYEEKEKSQTKAAEHSSRVKDTSSEFCCMCLQRLYVTDRYSDHGYFFHRHCFKCDECHVRLHVRSSLVKREDNGRVRFYCFRHGYMAGLFDTDWERDETDCHPNKDTEPSELNGAVTLQDPPENELWEPSRGSTEYDVFMSDPSRSSPEYDVFMSEFQDELHSESDEEPEFEEIDYSRCEEDVSSEDSDSDDDYTTGDFDQWMADKGLLGDDNMDYQSTASLRLFLGDTIQRGLGEVEQEEDELEERGMKVEQSIREEEIAEQKPDDELMDEWLDVLQKKKELTEKESKLMLQVMLMELEEKHLRLRTQLGMVEPTKELVAEVKALKDETKSLEIKAEMVQLTKGLTDLTFHLNKVGESTA